MIFFFFHFFVLIKKNVSLQRKVLYNMNEKDINKTLSDIRDMMSQSSRFQAINGWSIIVIGLLAAVASYFVAGILGHVNIPFYEYFSYFSSLNTPYKIKIAIITLLVLLVACLTIVFVMAFFKSKRHNLRFSFDKRTIMMIFDFFVPLAIGGLLSCAMVMQHHYGLTSSVMLIFYGLALLNCSHYTYPILRWLGYSEVLLGIIDCFSINHSLLFWFLGFSVLHVLFGIVYILKFERNNR